MALLGTEVADAYIEIHADASPLHKEIERAARKAGKSGGDRAGKEFTDAFDARLSELGRSLRTKMDKGGKDSGVVFSDAMRDSVKGRMKKWDLDLADAITTGDFDRINKQFDSVGDMAVSVRDRLQQLRAENQLGSHEFDRSKIALAEWLKAHDTKEIEDFQAVLTKAHGQAIKENEERTRSNQEHFARQAVQYRQWAASIEKAHGEAIRMNTAYDKSIQDMRDKQIQAYRDIEMEQEGLANSHDRLRKKAKDNEDSHRSFGGFLTKRLRAIIAAVIVSMDQLAVLGSGLGSTLTALAGSVVMASGALLSLGGVAIGAGYSVALAAASMDYMKATIPGLQDAMTNLNRVFQEVDAQAFGDAWGPSLTNLINTLAASLEFDRIAGMLGQAAARATDAFTAVLTSESWTAFVTAMEGPLSSALGTFGEAVAKITEGFLGLFAAGGPAAQELADRFLDLGTRFSDFITQASSDGTLTEFFDLALESMAAVNGFLGPLALALGNVFFQGAESGNNFLGVLGGLAQDFLDWTNSLEGQNALQEWFENGERIMSALLPFIGKLAEALADMVTPESIGNFEEFLQALGDALPYLSDFLSMIGSLNILGLLAATLENIGIALDPIMPLLEELGTIIGDLLMEAVVALGPLLADLFTALIPALEPLIPLIQDFLVEFIILLEEVLPMLVPLVEWLAEAFVQVLGAIQTILDEDALSQWFADAEESIDQFITGGAQAVIDWFGDVAESIDQFITGGATSLVDWFQNLEEEIDLAVTAMWEAIVGEFRIGWEQIVGFVTDIYNDVTGWFQDLYDTLVGNSIVPDMVTAIIDAFAGLVSGVVAWVTDLYNQAVTWFTNMATRIGEKVSDGVTAVVGFFAGLPSKVSSALSTLASTLSEKFTTAWTRGKEAVTTGIESARTLFSELPGKVMTALGDLGKTLYYKGRDLVQGLIDGVASLISRVATAIWDGLSNMKLPSISLPSLDMPWNASGAIYGGPSIVGVGEAGPEAIVPLRRPLAMVDPSVRALSAFAQGKMLNPTKDTGRRTVIEAGAITVVSRASNEHLVAIEVLDEFARNGG